MIQINVPNAVEEQRTTGILSCEISKHSQCLEILIVRCVVVMICFLYVDFGFTS